MKRRFIYSFFILMITGCGYHPSVKWDFKTFYKPAENPVLSADSSFTFTDPIKNETVRWQRADVFNPAAIVKDNKVFLLYRSEDNPAAILGGRLPGSGWHIAETVFILQNIRLLFYIPTAAGLFNTTGREAVRIPG